MKSTTKTQSGFSLIELMIVVAIVAILVSIAVPSYSSWVTNARRTDATSFLLEVAGEQQRYFTENNEFAEEMSDLGYGNAATADSPEGHYNVSIVLSNNDTRFVMTATRVANGAQANDTECGDFILSSTGAKSNSVAGATGCW